MSRFSIVNKFRSLPQRQQTGLAIAALLILWFSGWFSILSIGLGTWWLWNWWQKRRSPRQSPQMFTPNNQPSPPPVQPPPPSPVYPPVQPPPPQNQQPQNPGSSQGTQRPNIDWRNNP